MMGKAEKEGYSFYLFVVTELDIKSGGNHWAIVL